MGAFDQAGQVGQYKIRRIDAHHAQLRCERRERIIGDLRPRRRDAGEEGRFSRIRPADQAGIGNQLQLEDDGLHFGRLARIGAARRLVRRALEMGVAETAIAALEQHDALAGLREIADQRFAVFLVNFRAYGHTQHSVVAIGARHFSAHAVLAAPGRQMLLVSVVDQRVEIVDRFRPHIAAAPAIAAIRAAIFDEFLAAERRAAVSARAARDIDLGDIEEFHRVLFHEQVSAPGKNKKGRWRTISLAPMGRPAWRLDHKPP